MHVLIRLLIHCLLANDPVLPSAATVGTRAHYLLDLPAGFLIAYLVVRYVFLPWEERKSFRSPQACSWPQLAGMAAVPLVMWAIYDKLNAISGWQGLSNFVN